MKGSDVGSDKKLDPVPSLGEKERTQSFHNFISFIVKGSERINLFFPLFWVLLGQALMAFLLNSEMAVDIFSAAHNSFLSFTRINSAPPFSAPIAKAYTAILVLIIPVQFGSLIMLEKTKVMHIVRRKNRKDFIVSFVFVLLMCIVFAFFFRLGNYGPLRLLGGGVFAASIATPCITSIFSLMFAMAYFIVNDNERGGL